ncbi:hypothetical protein [Pseudomonas guariconensis]|uniref:hypothetical protein n=1 Tax=Pseudomonas guariconensis TaxID=1288410 RepID=UPI0018D90B75|nr:hypothetical protein [Pseudomonas guariconensis]MBH3361172.1 hypothetical protein [Pseudomonas guariconensis]
MPTENRSSNTEMVSAPFKREERYIVIKVSDLASVPVAVGEPFAEQLTAIQRRLPKREYLVIESDWPEYEPAWAAIEARVTGKPAEQHQGKPVGTLLIDEYFDGREVGDVDVQLDTKACGQLAEKYPGHSLPLYICPAPTDPGEVERLTRKAANADLALATQTRQVHSLRAQLAERDALLREVAESAAWGIADLRMRIEKVLSVNAEPSAPKVECCKLCGGEGSTRTGIDEAPTTVCSRCDGTGNEPSAPVERDERAVIKPDAWRVSINGNWEYFRSYEQALKELREWQSDYLPEEFEEAKADGLCEPEPVYARAALERRPS